MPERVTLTLGAEPVDLSPDEVRDIRDRLVEQALDTQELRESLAEALVTGHGRIVEAHRLNLISALEAMHSLELRQLWKVAQKPILLTDSA